MANLFVDNAGSNTSPYDTWAKAATTLLTATAAAAAGDSIYVAETHSEAPTVDTTYTLADGVRIICVNNDGGGSSIGALATTASISSATSGVDFFLAGGPAYLYGLTIASTHDVTCVIRLAGNDTDQIEAEQCQFKITGNSVNSRIQVGANANSARSLLMTKNCSFTWGSTSQGFETRGAWRSYGDDFVAGATVPATLFKTVTANELDLQIHGGDLSDISGTIFGATPDVQLYAQLWGCKINASVTVVTTGQALGEVYLFDCASGDTHYALAHYSHEGSTVAATAIYPTGGAKYDGTNPVSWTISGNANTSKAAPYRSPWIDDYNATLSSMTPYLEAVRDGSATKYNDDEVWSEWMAKTTAGSTRATLFSERTIAGTANALASSSLGAGDWTGESGTAAFMKLQPDAAFTPAEIGHIRARVGISGNHTIIVDPLIRY